MGGRPGWLQREWIFCWDEKLSRDSLGKVETRSFLTGGGAYAETLRAGETRSVERTVERSEWPLRSEWPGCWEPVEGALKRGLRGRGCLHCGGPYVVWEDVSSTLHAMWRPKKCLKGVTWSDLNLSLHLTSTYQVPTVHRILLWAQEIQQGLNQTKKPCPHTAGNAMQCVIGQRNPHRGSDM